MKDHINIGIRETIIHEVVIGLVVDVGDTEIVLTDKVFEEFITLVVGSEVEGSICITSYENEGLGVHLINMVNSVLEVARSLMKSASLPDVEIYTVICVLIP